MSKPKRTTNRESWKYVDKREEFQGSSLRGTAYPKPFGAESAAGSWLNEHERQQYEDARLWITYVVWSFYTPIAYYIEGSDGTGHWYKVGQSFSSYTGRHRNGALRNLPTHPVQMTGDKGDWTVTCNHGTRHFTSKRDAERVLYNHR